MRRLAPVLAGIAGVGIVMPFLLGVGTRSILLLLPLFGGLGAVAVGASRRTAVAERGWSTAPVPVDPEPATAVGRPSRRRPGRDRQVAAALARVEARELATSPWFGVGLGFLAVAFAMFAGVYADDNGSHWADMVSLAPWLAHPLVGMVVVAGHRGVTRARRDGTDELFDTCPAGATTRTWGSLGSAWVPVLALVAFDVVFLAALALRSPNLYGSLGADAVATLLGSVVLGVGGVVLGVALGRWVRFALAPVVAVVVVGFFSLKLATMGDPGWNPWQELSTLPPVGSLPPVFTDPAAWSHLGWLLALTGGVAVVALARHRRDRVVAASAVAACLLLVATGVAATRPLPRSSAERIAGLVAHPADHQVCRAAGTVQVCVFAGHGELLDRVVDEVMPVAAALPDAASPPTLRQRFPEKVGDLPPGVVRRLPGGVPPVPAGEVALGFDVNPGELLVPRLRIALHALGLPVEAAPDKRPLVLAGQARGVVTLWAATRGLGAGTVRQLTSGRTSRNGDMSGPADAFDRGYVWPGECATSPVVWSAQDLRAARALAALPDATVKAAVHQGWGRWSDPATGTDELLTALGLPPAGPFDTVQTRVDDPC